MIMSGTKDSKLDMTHSFFPGDHFTGMEEARNLWNIVRSFLAIAICGPVVDGPQTKAVKPEAISPLPCRLHGRFSAPPPLSGRTLRRRASPPAAAAGRWSRA